MAHPAKPDEPKASLRAELLGQIMAAQFELEATIADLTRDGAPASALIESRSQLGALTALSRQMAGASMATLAEMRAEIAAAVASSQSAAQQARSAAAGKVDTAELMIRAGEARAKVNEVMRGMKDFDPYLHFSSGEEEAEYRKREEERRAYIAAEQAKGTPQGDLNAANAAVDQMKDAKAHGAGDSPDFARRMAGLEEARNKLREAMPESPSTERDAVAKDAVAKPSQYTPDSPDDLTAAMAAFRDAGIQVSANVGDSPVPPRGTSTSARAVTSGRA